jgi:hypothetical protein
MFPLEKGAYVKDNMGVIIYLLDVNDLVYSK